MRGGRHRILGMITREHPMAFRIGRLQLKGDPLCGRRKVIAHHMRKIHTALFNDIAPR